METKRVSIKSGKPYDVYIGRPSKWGNIYSSKSSKYAKYLTKNRKESIEKYREYILNNQELLNSLDELRGKTIACWCDENQSCHGDILIKLLNIRRLF